MLKNVDNDIDRYFDSILYSVVNDEVKYIVMNKFN